MAAEFVEHLWLFAAVDTWSFRDGRPFQAGEDAASESVFPPSSLTLMGAVRTAILRHQGVDPAAYGQRVLQRALGPREAALYPLLGDADSPGQVRLVGPYLYRDDTWLFPAPLDLVRVGEGGPLALLRPGPPVVCDLGVVRLPRLEMALGGAGGAGGPGAAGATGAPGGAGGVKTLEGRWLPATALAAALAGRPQDIDPRQIWAAVGEAAPAGAGPLASGAGPLAAWERRIGLARDRARKAAREGLLYSAAHVRPARGVRLAARVAVPDAGLVPPSPLQVLLGGEGRQAQVEIRTPDPWPAMPPLAAEGGRVRFRLVLTTPGRFGGSWLPPGLAPATSGGATVWRGELRGVPLEVVSACVGKAVRVGGWDLARGRPRPLAPCVPAGSVYFCQSEAPPAVVARLHGAQLGDDTAYGFGHVLVGAW